VNRDVNRDGMNRNSLNRDGMNRNMSRDGMNHNGMNRDSIYRDSMNHNVSQGGRRDVRQGGSRYGGQFSYSAEADKENVGNAQHYGCYDPPLPNSNCQLQQWETSGLSYTNDSYDANEESAAGALVNIAGNY
jgi:hypothetical protein